jgi:signal transduction histidine kinase
VVRCAMASDPPRGNPDREQTDESLRAERQRADDLGASPTSIEETADAVIEKARERADRVLAEARRRTDHQLPSGAPGAESRMHLAHERMQEDAALSEERGAADDILRAERAAHAAALEAERDETDRHLSRERARADVAVSTRDEFLAVVSHDLRNMLSAVLGFASLIAGAELADDRDKSIAFAGRIQRSGTRMNRLIGDLVDLASIEAGRLTVAREVADPTPVVDEAVDTFRAEAAARGVSLLTEIDDEPPLASFDSARLLQVLVNLITNALKFTPSGGSVVVHLHSAGEEVRFAVSDTGIGIPEDKVDTLFERFRQLAPNDRRGVGLGLYISKCIVSGHGGKIGVESRFGKGSTFFFTLPAAK